MKINLDKAFNDVVKNAKLDSFPCPQCNNNLWSYSFKELNRLWKLYCKTCEQDVEINMDKIDNKFKI